MTLSSESVAGDGVAHRQGEKGEAEGQQDDVHHLHAPADGRFGAASRLFARDAPFLVCIKSAKNDFTFVRSFV
jgi:hypothetical protein